jgi:hypothetical protein
VRTLTLLVRQAPFHDRTGSEALPAGVGFIVARGRSSRPFPVDATSWLCQRFGLARGPDWSIAPILANAAGQAGRHPAWLCADPVHVEIRPSGIKVVPAAVLALTDAQSAALVSALDQHFARCGVRVVAFERDRWLINAPGSIALDTAPLDAAGNTRLVTVRGRDAPRWNAFLTEAQMLLHAHPVNAAREARGELPINSVHLWGGGSVSEVALQPTDSLAAADDRLVTALCKAAGVEMFADAAQLIERLQTLPRGSALVVGAAAGPLHQAVAAIAHDWLQPALQALKYRSLDQVHLLWADATGLIDHSLTRGAFWRFWEALRGPAAARAHSRLR